MIKALCKCTNIFRKDQRGHRVREMGTLWALTFVEVGKEDGKTLYLDIVFLPHSKRSSEAIVPEVMYIYILHLKFL